MNDSKRTIEDHPRYDYAFRDIDYDDNTCKWFEKEVKKAKRKY